MPKNRIDLEMEKTLLRGKELLGMTISRKYYPSLKKMFSIIDKEETPDDVVRGKSLIIVLTRFRGAYKTYRGFFIVSPYKPLYKHKAVVNKTFYPVFLECSDEEVIKDFRQHWRGILQRAIDHGKEIKV